MNSDVSDAELRCIREDLGMPAQVVSDLTGYTLEIISKMEHGDMPVPEDFMDKIRKITEVTDDFIDRLIDESKERGYILTVRFNAELNKVAPEYSDFGSMWHRGCAFKAAAETNLPVKYGPKMQKVRI